MKQKMNNRIKLFKNLLDRYASKLIPSESIIFQYYNTFENFVEIKKKNSLLSIGCLYYRMTIRNKLN